MTQTTINLELKQAEELVELRDAMLRLKENKDFKKVISDNYFKEEAIRLTMASANINLNKEMRDNVKDMASGIGFFAAYCDDVIRRGDSSETAIKAMTDEQNAQDMGSDDEDMDINGYDM